jgi:hypothetical protein
VNSWGCVSGVCRIFGEFGDVTGSWLVGGISDRALVVVFGHRALLALEDY